MCIFALQKINLMCLLVYVTITFISISGVLSLHIFDLLQFSAQKYAAMIFVSYEVGLILSSVPSC